MTTHSEQLDHGQNGQPEQPEQSFAQNILEWGKAIMIALVVVLVFRWLLFTPTIVSGISMEPSFYHNERIIVNKLIYRFAEPKRGEVVVFHAFEDADYIKRVIAVGGDKVRVDGDDVYVNEQIIEEPYLKEQLERAHQNGLLYNVSLNFNGNDGTSSVLVPEGTVFVLGDNRPRSKDSRSAEVGFVNVNEITGRADAIFWPVDRLQLIKHPKDVDSK